MPLHVSHLLRAALFVALLPGFTACRNSDPSEAARAEARPPAEVQVAEVTGRDEPVVIETTGSFYAAEQSEVAPEASGRVVATPVDVGQHVRAGSPLARLQAVDLVRAAQDGDRAAFGLLYERYGPMVHGVLLARVGWDDVEDLVQDVFVTALQRLRTLRNAGAFGGWLAAIARNRATDHHRRGRWTDSSVAVDGLQAVEQGPAAEALAALAAIRSLPPAYRETLTLRLVEGMTGPEIAARTGLTPASVRVNLHRGMKQLREKLEVKREEP